MEKLSSNAEKLLTDIINNKSTDYWNKRFDNLSYDEDLLLRSQFKELKDKGMIKCAWADNVPSHISVLNNGIEYNSQKNKDIANSVRGSINSWLKVIIGTIIGTLIAILLQQYFGLF